MAILGRVPKDQLGTLFTHKGWLLGICPVYIAHLESESPTLIERNWIPEWWHDMTLALFGAYCLIATSLAPEFEPMFPITVTGEIKRTDAA